MSSYDLSRVKIVALSGGVGGAKLALGLSKVVTPGELLIVTNTGDDFDHFGLRICPDTDTVFYNLAGLADNNRGWGRDGETWNFLGAVEALGGDTWFQLGDRDLALHHLRTQMLKAGAALSEVTATMCARANIAHPILPATDDRLATIVHTPDGPLNFQTYFVREQCRPKVTGFDFDGAKTSSPAPGVLDVLTRRDLTAVVFCPSNPYVSLDPILAVPGIRSAIVDNPAPKIGVSPIIGGEALKGPAAKMMQELGVEPSSSSFASHYKGILDGLLIDETDRAEEAPIAKLGIAPKTSKTIMSNLADKIALAQAVLDFAGEITSTRST